MPRHFTSLLQTLLITFWMNGNPRTAKSHGISCGCVGVLMGVLGLISGLVAFYFFPHLIGLSSLKKPRGSVIALAISNAVEQFYGDYNKLPVPLNSSPAVGDTDTDTSPESRMVTIITGKEDPIANPQNTKNIDYAEGIKPAKTNRKDGPPWKDGLMSDATTEAPGIVDPWGNYFRIRLDSDGNKELANPNPDQVAEGRTKIIKRVLVWSAGKDSNWDTWEDNPMSWD